MEPEFYTVPEVASILRLTRQYVGRLVRGGEIESVRFGRRAVRIPRAAVDRFRNCGLEPSFPMRTSVRRVGTVDSEAAGALLPPLPGPEQVPPGTSGSAHAASPHAVTGSTPCR
jgi:excisionase family DNA binding protein